MKKSLLVSLLGAGLLAGCETASRPPAALPISVSVSPSATQTLDQGQSQTAPIKQPFTAAVTNDSANKGVTWTVTCSVADCGSFNPTSTASGVATTYMAPAMVSGNLTVTVTATSVSDTTKKSAPVTVVVSPPPQLPSTTAIQNALNTANPNPMTGTPFSFQFTLSSGGAGTINWKVFSGSLPAGLTLSSSGLLSGIPKLTKPGQFRTGFVTSSTPSSFTVQATDSGNPAMVVTSGTLTITVSPSNITVTITSPTAPPTIQQGQTVSITATVAMDPATQGVTWSVSCSATACGSVSPTSTPSGTATTFAAPASVSANLAVTVTATSVGDTSKTASITVTVTPPPISVTITSPTSPPTIPQGQTVSITATVANDPAHGGVNWSAACSTSPCGTFNPTGTPSGTPTTYTAPTSVSATLTVTVTATSVSDTTKFATITVTVTPIMVSVAPTTASVVVNGTQQFTPTVTNDPANNGVTWTLTQSGTACGPACGSISLALTKSGTATTYTAPATVPANPTVTITATSVTDSTKSASATITVTAAPPISVSVAPPTASVTMNGTAQFTATVTNTSNTAVTWTLTQSGTACSPTCGMLSSTTANPTTYTAPATVPTPNTVTITATSVADTTKSGSATITITANNNAKLSGDFALQFTGFADSGSRVGAGEVAVIGRFHADGNGNLTVGVLDFNTPNGSFPATTFTGTYSVGSDNRFTLTANLAPGGTFIARGALEPTAIETRVGRIIEFDDSNGMAVRGSGEIHVQTLTDATFSRFTGDFALGFIGDITVTSFPNARLGVVGRFTLGTTGTFSAGQVDVSVPGTSFSSSLPGQLSAPDATTGRGIGTVTITIPPPIVPTATNLTLHIAYVVVGHHQAFVIVTDQRAANVPLLSGFVSSQRQPTFGVTSLTGPIVFAVVGTCGSPNTSTAMASVAIGHIVADGNGNFTSGVFDQNECGSIISNTTITGTYTVDPTVKGRVTINVVSSAMPKPEMLYLRDINKGFLLEGTAATPGNEVTFGIISPQTLPTGGSTDASLAGTYGFGTAEPSATGVPDISGVVTLTSAATPPSSVSGTADVSLPPPVTPPATTLLLPDAAVSGTYTVDVANATAGRFTASATIRITIGGVTVTIPLNLVVYQVGPGAFVSVEVTSGNTASAGAFFEQ